MYKTKWFCECMEIRLKDKIIEDDTITPFSLIDTINQEMGKKLTSRQIVILLTISSQEQHHNKTDIKSIYKYLGEALHLVDDKYSISDYLSELDLKNELNYLVKIGFLKKEEN